MYCRWKKWYLIIFYTTLRSVSPGNDRICNPDSFEVILASDVDTYKVYKLKELLPVSFNQENL